MAMKKDGPKMTAATIMGPMPRSPRGPHTHRDVVVSLTLCLAVATVFLLTPHSAVSAAPAALISGSLWTATAETMTAANGWTLQGAAFGSDGALHLQHSPTPLACSAHAVDDAIVTYDKATGFCTGRDPHAAGAYDGRNYYNGARFAYGVLLSPRYNTLSFNRAVPSWVVATPPGTWVQVHLRALLSSGVWTAWARMPVWASSAGLVQRHAIDGQNDVTTDTFVLASGQQAVGFQLSITLFAALQGSVPPAASPTLHRLSLALYPTITPEAPAPRTHPAWGLDLAVPARSQMLSIYQNLGYGGGGEAWCSPTSVSMLLAYWAKKLSRPDLLVSVPAVARGVYDWTYDGAGNWPFNIAYATTFPGMDGYVARLGSLDEAEHWIANGVPLALSIAFAPGGLPGAPIDSTNGHLIVLRGFTASGDPIVDDPAAPDSSTVRRVYPRAALQQVWLSGSGGTGYVLYPRGLALAATTTHHPPSHVDDVR